MLQSARENVLDDFVGALSDLVECYTDEAPAIVMHGNCDVRETRAAIVGFGDERLRGAAALLANDQSIEHLAKTAPANPADWLGEFCNQLVGRFKNKLSEYGILPQMGTPIKVSGTDFSLDAVGTEPSVWQVNWSNGQFQALLSLEVENALELVRDPCSAVAEEGSLSLF
jgi:hypothetical protein